MTGFGQLPVPAQNAVCFGALLGCFCSLACCILFWREKRRGRFALSALDFLGAYALVHLCRAITEARLHGAGEAAAAFFARTPYAAALAFLALVLALAAALFAGERRWRKTHVTPASIKESMDGLPAGVCYYLEEGRCVLVNHRMNDVCRALTGRDLQNGAAFFEAVRGESVHVLPDGTAVAFRHRELEYEHAPLFELIADDITELHRESERLRRDNERMRRLGESMRAYGQSIGETVRRQEILEAKIRIHDEMNSLLLATQRSLQPASPEADRAEVLQLWQSQSLLLRKAADAPPEGGVVTDLGTLAGVVGVELCWDGRPETDDEAALRLFLLAAREAMANAVRHARAARLFIRVRTDGEKLTASFTNDGAPPTGEIRETGGLGNLRRKLAQHGGTMRTAARPRFHLEIEIPIGGDHNGMEGADR